MSDATMDPPILAALLVGHFRRMRDDRLASLRRKRNLLRMSLVVHAITDELDDAEPTCRAVVLTLPTPAKAWAASPSSCQPPPSPPPWSGSTSTVTRSRRAEDCLAAASAS